VTQLGWANHDKIAQEIWQKKAGLGWACSIAAARSAQKPARTAATHQNQVFP